MALTYLSGDYLAGKKKSSGGGGGGAKRSGGVKRGGTTKVKKTKAEKKQARKRVFKKVAKVAVAPARTAFLTVVRLNALKLATKLVRVYKQPNGSEQLQKFWSGFGGDYTKLKQAMAKGSKQTINADYIGSAVATALATATPIIVALVPILKNFKAGGDAKEAKEFDNGVNEAKRDLADDADTPKSTVSMPKNKEVGVVADKNGESTEDKKQDASAPESKSGGTDGETANSSGGGGSSDDGTETATNGKTMTKSDAEKTMSSTFSPLGFFFMILMYAFMLPKNINANLQSVISIICLYALIAIVLIPFALSNHKTIIQRIAFAISYLPFNYLQTFISKIKWQKV